MTARKRATTFMHIVWTPTSVPLEQVASLQPCVTAFYSFFFSAKPSTSKMDPLNDEELIYTLVSNDDEEFEIVNMKVAENIGCLTGIGKKEFILYRL